MKSANGSTSLLLASPRSWSLTIWITFFCAIASFVLISLIAALLYGGLASQLRNQNSLYLHDEVSTIENLLHVQRSEEAVMKELGSGQSGPEYVKHYIRLMDHRQRVIMETPHMGRVLPPNAFPLPPRSGVVADKTWRTPDGKTLLTTFSWVQLQWGGGDLGVLQVALDVTNVDEILVGYREKIYLVVSVGFLVCLVVSFLVATEATRPLREMTATVRRITATNLQERISGERWPQELHALGDAFNQMMNRLEDSFARLYKSATNLSHKMRTPLTILRGEAEVALASPRSAEELQEVIASSLEEVGRLTRLADSILFLADAEMGKFHLAPALIDAREEVEKVVDYYLPSAEERGISITCQGAACIFADGALFRKAVAALVSNALTYNGSGGEVEITLLQGEECSGNLIVRDNGCGIPSDEMQKVFDRFYRIYGTRHMDPHGTGLGLPIVQAIMALHGGNVSLQSRLERGTSVILSFPPPKVSASDYLGTAPFPEAFS